ncbi:MAG TPA: exodeoxyribonuclease III [Candidatus Jeotgalibaca merdavium]|jgi:exodeoxyribonuclease III|uniref:Exodeoxyribonuclease n=2 Tax=Jeotgalibaca TaxID=1470540 RepID=A0A6G7KAM4_9LACT|nr:exodeoxyribonuclease III [Jeotgalibaca arthritidis]QII82319.1 exodeoxyribonuclease III [Jeotgalibaca arthritidis]HJA91081.1 exodeoxyribonuclease III [Candidatus Jeotgalibaca merdavium]
MKFISWNIDSLNAGLTSDSARALLTRETFKHIIALDADVVAIQETKLSAAGLTKKHTEVLADLAPAYESVWRSSVEPARKGYAGTLFLYKKELNPIITFPEIGAPTTMDCEGRMITLELDDLFVTQVYTPNAGNELARLADRQIWDEKYADYLAQLDQTKPVVAMGDFNVAHKEIDLAHPDRNHFSAGFTDEERQGFTNLLARGFTDSFRHLHGNIEGAYTWWAQRVKTSKINNSGWRIDYSLVSDRIADKVLRSEVIDSGTRQDHAPLLIELDL